MRGCLILVFASMLLAGGAAAEETMTLRFYKRATAQGGEAGAAAERYVDGTLHGMLLVSDALQRDGTAVFCGDPEEASAGDLQPDRLAAGFRGWLASPQARADAPELQQAPIALFVLTYLNARLPCARGGDAELGEVLRRTLPE